MKNWNRILYTFNICCILLILSLAHIQCTTTMFAGGSDTEISGCVLNSDGKSASGARVLLVPVSFNPAFDDPDDKCRFDTSNLSGNYRFKNVSPGEYNIIAESFTEKTKILQNGIVIIEKESKTVQPLTLRKTASLRISLPDSLQKVSGYVYIPGTTMNARTDVNHPVVVFEDVPQGFIGSIEFSENKQEPGIVLSQNLLIETPDTIKIGGFTEWSCAAKLVINTTVQGTYLSKELYNFPVCVKLSDTNFDFSKARTNGEDIRFSSPDDRSLPYENEYYDSTTHSATFWVLLDTIKPDDSTQYFMLYWGNPAAKNGSKPSAVFDTARYFQGVWHLGQSGGNTQKDATAHHYDGTPVALNGSSDVMAVISRGIEFNGSSQCIKFLNTSNSALDVQSDSFYTVSVWVYAKKLQKDNVTILSKGQGQYGLMINEQNYWTFYSSYLGSGVDTTTTNPVSINEWVYLTGVRSGLTQYLYINGTLVDSSITTTGINASLSDKSYDFTIGRQSDDESEWFAGIIDEVRVESTARSEEWVKFCFENQKTTTKAIKRIRER